MPSETPTPRTDTQFEECSGLGGKWNRLADVSRQLEKELNEAKKLIHDTAQGIVQAREDNLRTVLKTAQSRDDYQDCCDGLAKEHRELIYMINTDATNQQLFLKVQIGEALKLYTQLQQKGQPCPS